MTRRHDPGSIALSNPRPIAAIGLGAWPLLALIAFVTNGVIAPVPVLSAIRIATTIVVAAVPMIAFALAASSWLVRSGGRVAVIVAVIALVEEAGFVGLIALAAYPCLTPL